MKKQYLYILGSALIAMNSCADLDRFPIEEPSEQTFGKTANDLEMMVSDLYRVMPDERVMIDQSINSDDAVHGIKWAAGNVSRGVYDPNDMSWNGDYEVIRKANLVMRKVSEQTNLPEAKKKHILGQAHFFRAFVYFGLIRAYGDVPYTEEVLSLDDQKGIKRSPRGEVYDKVMADLDKATEYLPKSWSASEYGRATQGAALAMKARVALYFGKWDTAASSAKRVIDLGQYELFDKANTGRYKELFWERTDGNKELILVRQFKANQVDSYLMGWHSFPTVGWGGINPTQSLVDAFEDSAGAPIAKSTLYDEKKPFENRDPRLEVCVLHDGESIFGKTIKVAPLKSAAPTGIGQHNDATATGYYNQKYLDPSINPSSEGWNMGKDAVIIRYAEVLLTYAEAMNELKPLAPEALDAVNQVRARVGMPALQSTNAALPTYCGNGEDLRQRIRNEWRVEFAMEGGKRQWDIRRWGIASEVLNAPFLGLKYKLVDSPNADPKDGGKICLLYEGQHVKLSGSKYAEHNYLYPIPQSQLDLHGDNFTQNPGYNR